MIKGNEHEHENEQVEKYEQDSTLFMSRILLFIEKTRNDDDDEDDNVDHAKKGRKVGREVMIPNDTVM